MRAKMKKSKILLAVVAKVEEATEIKSEDIISASRKEENVDARLIVIYCCIKKGLRPVQVAEMLNQTPHNIYRSLRSIVDRYAYSSSFRYDCDLVCKELGISCDLSSK